MEQDENGLREAFEGLSQCVDKTRTIPLSSSFGCAAVNSIPQPPGEEQMSEKKVKIDLKARLGRASKGAAGGPGAVPTPVAGIAPPPGIVSGGIPAPPFAAQPKKPAGPKIDKDEPFAAVSSGEVAPQPQEIKIEIGHDVVEAQKKGSIKLIVAVLAAAAIAGGVGFAIGGLREGNKQDHAAVADAQSLIAPVNHAKEGIESLQSRIESATKSLFKERKYPDGVDKQLNDIDIGFTATELAGKALHRLKPSVVRDLLDFARDAEELTARKTAVSRLLLNQKVAIVALLDQGNNPQIGYGVFVQKDKSGNAIGTFVPFKSPFRFEEKTWPDEIELNTGAEVAKGTRYKSGEPFLQAPRREGEKPTIFTIPLEPDGVTKAFSSALSQRIKSELETILTIINGTETGVHTDQERRGLLKLAEDITRELSSVGAKR